MPLPREREAFMQLKQCEQSDRSLWSCNKQTIHILTITPTINIYELQSILELLFYTCIPIRCHTTTRASQSSCSMRFQPWHQICLICTTVWNISELYIYVLTPYKSNDSKGGIFTGYRPRNL